MNHNLEIQKILLKVDQTANPDDKIILLKQAIQTADANNDLEWGVDLRLDLIHKENKTSHQKESFPAFVWILDAYEKNLDIFEEDDFLWEYKWMVEDSIYNPNITLEQIDNILEDFKKRLERNGFTLHPYYNLLACRYLMLNDYSEARHMLEKRDSISRDNMSDCLACEHHTTLVIELKDHRFDVAITKGHDLITHKVKCGEQPFLSFCELMFYLEHGKDSRSETYYLKAKEELENQEKLHTSQLAEIGQFIYYLNRHNPAEAWQYFEQYAHWENDAKPIISYNFSKYILPMLQEEGQKQLNLDPTLAYYNTEGIYDIQALFAYYDEKATRLATLYDQRNGTNTYIEELTSIFN